MDVCGIDFSTFIELVSALPDAVRLIPDVFDAIVGQVDAINAATPNDGVELFVFEDGSIGIDD